MTARGHILPAGEGMLEILFAIGEAGLVLVDHLSAGQVVGCPAIFHPYTYYSIARSLTEVEVLKIDAIGRSIKNICFLN